MLVKTSELTGSALDWSVAEATGKPLIRKELGGLRIELCRGIAAQWAPSFNWHQGGPLIDKYGVWLSDDTGEAVASCYPHVNEYVHVGPTRLTAACRAIVHLKLGDEVDVPEELLS